MLSERAGEEFLAKVSGVIERRLIESGIEAVSYTHLAGHPALPRGEYQLSQHVGERCVYTFCMCPGGQVVASASEEGRVVTLSLIHI